MVAARRDKEDVLVGRKCRCEELRGDANEPICQSGGFAIGNEYSLCRFSWPRHLEKIYRLRIAYRLSHLRVCPSATKDDASFC